MKVRASATIGPGMVAENSMVCRRAGNIVSSFSMSGKKPRSSISSASSSTRMRTACQDQVMLLDQIQEPTWSADDDIDPSIEGLHLRFVRPATVNGGDAGTETGAGRSDITGYLDRQFSGRGDDECLRTCAGRTRQIKPGE